jgi:hypothetical protein
MGSFYQVTMVSHPHGSGLFLERGLNRKPLKTALSTVNCQLSTVNCQLFNPSRFFNCQTLDVIFGLVGVEFFAVEELLNTPRRIFRNVSISNSG